ncbi:substrate-binding periplasmic protein [Colwelliaceae bacterium 6441]
MGILIYKRRSFLSFIAIFLVLSFSAQSEQINVVTEFLEPYQIQNADGSLGGFSTDVINSLFELTNDKANIKVMPWARAYETALHQPNTLIYSIAHTPIRDKLFHWVGALKEERLFFWGLRKKFSNKNYQVNELKEYKIAVSRHSNTAQYVIAKEFTNIYQLANERQNMDMLFIDRVDLILATKITIETRAKKLGYDFTELQILTKEPVFNNKLSIAFSLNTPKKLVDKYKAAFQALIDNGRLAELKEKWKLH